MRDSIIPPDDPRYESWLLLRAFLQAEDSGARREFLRAIEKNGSVQLADILKLVERSFDASAKALAISVTGIVSAERRARQMGELFERSMDSYNQWFVAVEGVTGISARLLEAAARSRLSFRLGERRAEAFGLAFEEEIARTGRLPESEPSVSPAAIAISATPAPSGQGDPTPDSQDSLASTKAKLRLPSLAEQQAPQKLELATAPSGNTDENAGTVAGAIEPGAPGSAHAETTVNKPTNRRKEVDAYIEDVYRKTGERITRTDFWKSARYRTRTEFERWERDDPRATKTANERFIRILSDKPHLKPPPK